MATLSELESHLQSLLEIHLLKYLPGYKSGDGVAQQLAAAMQSSLKELDGDKQAPNIYVIVANPITLNRWHNDPNLLKELAETLYTVGNEAGIQFAVKPVVTTSADTNMPADELRILASFSTESMGETRGMPAETAAETAAEPIHSNAFLILGGTKIIPLNRSVVNIGRRLDNQVVIDDPRVSRAHAQLRIVKDRFVLFDLDSSGGTFINGKRASQSVLYPGDVISLAGVTLIFGQDLPEERVSNEDKTGPTVSISADRPTAIFRKEDLK
jgi:hypothetical protein